MKTAGEKAGKWESGPGMLSVAGHSLQWGARTEHGLTTVTLECSCGSVFSREVMGHATKEKTALAQAEAWEKAKQHLTMEECKLLAARTVAAVLSEQRTVNAS